MLLAKPKRTAAVSRGFLATARLPGLILLQFASWPGDSSATTPGAWWSKAKTRRHHVKPGELSTLAMAVMVWFIDDSIYRYIIFDIDISYRIVEKIYRLSIFWWIAIFSAIARFYAKRLKLFRIVISTFGGNFVQWDCENSTTSHSNTHFYYLNKA